MPVNAGTLWRNLVLEDTDPHETPEIQFVGTQGEVFYMLASDEDCEYTIQVQAFRDQWSDVASGSLLAGDLVVVDVTFYLPLARVVVTAKTAMARMDVSAYGYPAVYVRD